MNIAVVGSGYWGKNLVRNHYELGSLYAVCEMDPQKRLELAEKYPDVKLYSNYQELLNDKSVQGIVLATPAPTHFELAKQSLEADFPTYVEKPLTLDLESAEHLTNLANEKNLPLMVGHILEYHPAMVKMQELVNAGKIGNIKHIRCSRINLGKIRAHENIWWSFAPHDLSIIFMLLGQEPVEISASSFKPLQDGIEDTVYADLLFKDGQSAHIHVSWLEPLKLHQTVVIGEKAMLAFNDTLKENKLMMYEYELDRNIPNLNKGNEIPVEYEEGQPLKLECQHFIDCIKDNRNPKTDGASACRVIKVLEYVDKQLKREKAYV
jgi:UDP-2-acetamido-3-amino-2,3-dideoxy-glucuronate N-acetyltransferase